MATESPAREAPAAPAGASSPAAGAPDRPPGRRALLLALAVVCALVAVATAVSLPFAPVRHDRPVVTWPQDAAAPVSTSLMLVAHRPAALTASTTCATVRAAAQRGDGLVLSTMRPTSSAVTSQGLLWAVRDGQLRLDVAGTLVDTEPLPAGDCTLQVVTAGGGLQLLRDGRPVGEPTEVLPEVDSLVTSLTAVDPGAGERLSVEVAVDDEFASSPTPLKRALVGLLLLSGLACLVLLALLDRGRDPTPGRPLPRWGATLRPRPADGAVLLLVVAWAFLAPMTDDDGYYASMARNVAASGYVGQYYQLYDQSFVPLTWPWYALSWWTGVADTPLGLRVPAAALGLLTWVCLRRCADLLLGHDPRWGAPGGGGRVRGGATAVLALAFATAWTPYVMGVRPEGIAAAASAAVLAGVLTALRTGRQLLLALAVLAAALSCAAHPTGAVAVAPLVAAAPQLWRRLRADRVAGTLARLVAVVGPCATAAAAGFADGTLHDLVRGREVFAAIERPLGWTEEYTRYAFLFNQGIPMGAYAKRTVVVLALLAVVLSLLLVAAGRAHRAADAAAGDDHGVAGVATASAALALAAGSVLLALVALWVTPSKWTHHFGSLAGLAPVLLTALVLLGPGLARRVLPSRGGGAAGVAAVLGVVVVASVAMTGPNSWPYDDALGMPLPGVSPQLGAVPLRSPVVWLLVSLLVAGVLVVRRRRAATSEGAPLAPRVAATTAVVLMGVSTTYLVGSFTVATVATLDTYSPSAAMVTDPLARGCGAAGAVSVVDDTRAAPLTPAAGAPGVTSIAPAGAFVEGGGWWQNDPPPGTSSTAGPTGLTSDQPTSDQAVSRTALWGSLAAGTASTGELRTGWYDLGGALAGTAGSGDVPPSPDAPGSAVTVLAAGDLTGDLVAEYGVVEGGAVRVTTVEPLGDGVATTEWRSLRLGDRAAGAAGPDGVAGTADDPPAVLSVVPADDGGPGLELAYDQDLAVSADVVRLRATDDLPGPGGWMAVGAPTAAPVTTMSRYVPRDAVVATAWQRTYHFPCQEQVLTGHGISTRPDHALLVGGRSLEGANDSAWQAGRGGLFAQVPEAATLYQPASWYTDAPDVPWGQLARLEYAYPDRAYDVELVPEVRGGLAGPTVPPLD